MLKDLYKLKICYQIAIVFVSTALSINISLADTLNIPLDVIGISVGDSIDSAKDKMVKHNNKLDPMEVEARGGGIFAVVGQEVKKDQDDKNVLQEGIAIFPTRDGNVGSITYASNNEENPFTDERFINSLTEKFGKASIDPMFIRHLADGNKQMALVWYVGEDLKIHDMGRDFLASHNCYQSSFGDPEILPDLEPFARKIRTYSPYCVAIIEVFYTLNANDLVENYNISIGDVRTFYEDALAREKEKERAKDDERNKARSAADKSRGPTL